MRFDTSQHMKLGQHMKLAPRMIQSMEILQMPLAELQERIEQELESNVTLELTENDADPQLLREERQEAEREATEHERPLDVDEASGRDDFERLDSYESANPEAFDDARPAPPQGERGPASDYEPGSYSRSRSDGERDAKNDAMASAPARAASLVEQLRDQWALSDVEDALREPGELIISFIEEDGYLRTPLAVIADRAPPPPPPPPSVSPSSPSGGTPGARPSVGALERALRAVQLFLEPPGVAARDVRECLLLQLDAIRDERGRNDPSLQVARLLIEQHLDDLTQNRLPKIAERTGLPMEEIKHGIEQMRRLSLAPARRLTERTAAPIFPDAAVEYDDEADRYIAYLTDGRLPNVRINKQYAEMARDRAVEKKDREFIRTNLTNAQWLIDAIQQRRHTLQRVLNVVIDAQREFFDYGPQALKPLPMTQVADQLGIHVATVSRAVADKYLQTPRGILPLRKFFTGGMQTDSGEDMSYDAVRNALKGVIDAEDKAKPLSDDALAEELKRRGIEIARRTVAKYRDQLGIQSARLRRAY